MYCICMYVCVLFYVCQALNGSFDYWVTISLRISLSKWRQMRLFEICMDVLNVYVDGVYTRFYIRS